MLERHSFKTCQKQDADPVLGICTYYKYGVFEKPLLLQYNSDLHKAEWFWKPIPHSRLKKDLKIE